MLQGLSNAAIKQSERKGGHGNRSGISGPGHTSRQYFMQVLCCLMFVAGFYEGEFHHRNKEGYCNENFLRFLNVKRQRFIDIR